MPTYVQSIQIWNDCQQSLTNGIHDPITFTARNSCPRFVLQSVIKINTDCQNLKPFTFMPVTLSFETRTHARARYEYWVEVNHCCFFPLSSPSAVGLISLCPVGLLTTIGYLSLLDQTNLLKIWTFSFSFMVTEIMGLLALEFHKPLPFPPYKLQLLFHFLPPHHRYLHCQKHFVIGDLAVENYRIKFCVISFSHAVISWAPRDIT